MADRSGLLRDLDAARGGFLEVLADVDLELATVPGVMEDWSVRDLVVPRGGLVRARLRGDRPCGSRPRCLVRVLARPTPMR